MSDFSKSQAKAVDEILRRGGAVAASEWTSGAGRYVTKRAVPPYCREYDKGDACPAHVTALFDARPKVKKAVAGKDLAAAREAVDGKLNKA